MTSLCRRCEIGYMKRQDGHYFEIMPHFHTDKQDPHSHNWFSGENSPFYHKEAFSRWISSYLYA